MQRSLVTDIFIDSNDEIQEHMSDSDVMDYLRWRFEELDEDQLIKKLKVLVFDYDELDTILYDLDLTYMNFIGILCRTVPSMMTPHIIKQIRERNWEFEEAGQVDPDPIPQLKREE